jgi:hypothetical protein
MRRLSRSEALAFVQRWQLVAEAELSEARRQSPEEKLAAVSALMESARSLGWSTSDPDELETVRERWRRLVEHHRGSSRSE